MALTRMISLICMGFTAFLGNVAYMGISDRVAAAEERYNVRFSRLENSLRFSLVNGEAQWVAFERWGGPGGFAWADTYIFDASKVVPLALMAAAALFFMFLFGMIVCKIFQKKSFPLIINMPVYDGGVGFAGCNNNTVNRQIGDEAKETKDKTVSSIKNEEFDDSLQRVATVEDSEEDHSSDTATDQDASDDIGNQNTGPASDMFATGDSEFEQAVQHPSIKMETGPEEASKTNLEASETQTHTEEDAEAGKGLETPARGRVRGPKQHPAARRIRKKLAKQGGSPIAG